MSDRPRIYSRIQRREMHSPRSTVAIVIAVVLILALAYLATEIVLAAIGASALLLSPAGMVGDIAALNGAALGILGAAGGVLVLLGVILLVVALRPGRRARHAERSDRAAIVIDDEVIASALVRAAANQNGVSPDRAVGSVSHRRATVRITPSSGLVVDAQAVSTAVRDSLDAWGLTPKLRAKVVIAKSGRVGA